MWPAIYAYFSSTDDAHAVLERAFESPEKALKYQALTAFMSYALSQFNLLSYATQVRQKKPFDFFKKKHSF